MKIRLSELRQIIREEIEGDDMAAIMGRIKKHRDAERAAYEAEPAPVAASDLPFDRIDDEHPGAIDSHPEPERHRFWSEDGTLYSVDRERGHKSRMIYGADGRWHKFYNDAKPETVDRRRPGMMGRA